VLGVNAQLSIFEARAGQFHAVEWTCVKVKASVPVAQKFGPRRPEDIAGQKKSDR
jgi:hypothetical protein